ncbi:MAG: SRPBCC domain-containing protein [Myxococcota bacterium]
MNSSPSPVSGASPVRVDRVSLWHRRVHSEIVIDAPPEEVWRVLTDWDRLNDWSPTLLSLKGDIRDGSRVACEYRFGGTVLTPEHTLRYEEGVEFGWSDPMLPGMVDGHRYRVEALPDGRTRFVQTDEVRGGILAVLTGWFFIREMVETYPAFNLALKERVEAAETQT